MNNCCDERSSVNMRYFWWRHFVKGSFPGYYLSKKGMSWREGTGDDVDADDDADAYADVDANVAVDDDALASRRRGQSPYQTLPFALTTAQAQPPRRRPLRRLRSVGLVRLFVLSIFRSIDRSLVGL